MNYPYVKVALADRSASVTDLPVRKGCTGYCGYECFQSLTYPYLKVAPTTRSAFSPALTRM
ncbi:hypothetical protein DPMN_039565 [Dreissena polymorpha]|uniref:Uncharacterized protein n=1 Tax=Dreissena polymorpha TaxID=45954 RepID=A0A9D4CUC8_DREPO|nr:hypothetical protein DPMN_039565 [Dreissena polymorpha]